MLSDYLTFLYDSFIAYYLNDNPKMINWAITGGCNSNCAFCEVPKQVNSSKDLSYEKIASLIEEMHKLKVESVHLVGGEVFTRKDIWDILKLFKSKNISITITTNALLIPTFSNERLKILEETVNRIRVSLDTTKKEQYEKIRGVKGGYDKVIKSLEILSQLKNVKIIITSVITKNTLQEIPLLVNLAKQFRISLIDFQPVSPVTIFTNTVAEDKNHFLPCNEEDFKILRKHVDEGLRLSRRLNVPTTLPFFKIYGEHYFKSLINKEDRLYFLNIVNKFNCIKLFKSIFIDYDGSLKPCAILPPAGNIKDSGLKKEIEKIRTLKDKAKKGCYPYLCNKCFCNPGENIVFSIINNPLSNFKALKHLLF